VVCGRRWGKTACGLRTAIKGHGTEYQMIGANQGGNVWWVGPSFPVSQDIWRDLKRAVDGCWSDKDEVERRIQFPSGGAITVKSADRPDSLRGSGLHGLIIDESATVKPSAWKESLRPALSDKQGWAMFFGTPKGFNWFHDLWHEAPSRLDWMAWQRPSQDNPLITEAELEEARKDVGTFAFEQEYLAQFVTDGAGVFDRAWLTKLVTTVPRADKAVRYWDRAASTSGDWSVGCLIVEADGLFYVDDVVRGKWTPHERNKIIEQTAEMDAQRFQGRCSLWLEQEPGSSAVDYKAIMSKEWARFGPQWDKVQTDKGTRARPFAAACEAQIVYIKRAPWNREFIDEVVQFNPSAKNSSLHDDQVDAASGAFSKVSLKAEPCQSIPRAYKRRDW
jgi:predicted phage terminase large subunit-like protein